MDFAEARKRMVDGQLLPNRVSDPRLISAMLSTPREGFAPAAMASRALADADLPLGGGRVMLQPLYLARLIQLLAVRRGERVLVAPCDTGYAVAVLAAMGAAAIGVEAEERLLAMGRPLLPPFARVEQGEPAAGWPGGAPFEAVLVPGAVARIPAALEEQLAEGGRLAAVLQRPNRVGAAVLGLKTDGRMSYTDAFDCQTVLLPGAAPRSGFVLA